MGGKKGEEGRQVSEGREGLYFVSAGTGPQAVERTRLTQLSPHLSVPHTSPCPPAPHFPPSDGKGAYTSSAEMIVIPVALHLLTEVSTLRISIPQV